jgi:hypothetical protein
MPSRCVTDWFSVAAPRTNDRALNTNDAQYDRLVSPDVSGEIRNQFGEIDIYLFDQLLRSRGTTVVARIPMRQE